MGSIDKTITVDPSPFTRLKNNQLVFPLLKTRLPMAAQVLNMALLYPKFLNYMNIYVWDSANGGDTIGKDTWIVITSIREDIGQNIGISAPPDVEITEEVKDAFSNSKLFGWEETHLFVAISRPLARMVSEIDTHIKGNITSIAPCAFYYVNPEEALQLEISPKAGVSVKTMEPISGADFICKNWPYAVDGTLDYMKRFMAVNPSCGVFRNDTGEIVSGIVLICNGLMGMLYTLKNYRNKQYGTLAMQSLMKELAREGLYPCSTVDMYNDVSKQFHSSVGMKFSHFVDFVKFSKPKPRGE